MASNLFIQLNNKLAMYLKIKDRVEIIEAIKTLGREDIQFSEEGAKAFNLLCMKFHLYVE